VKFTIKLLLFYSVIFLSSLFFPNHALAADYQLSGSVVDNSLNAVGGATVHIYNINTTLDVVSPVTTTNESGIYIFSSVPEGAYDIQVNPPSGSNFNAATASNFTISKNAILNFFLLPAGLVSLSGHIYDSLGNPIQGISISLTTNHGDSTITSTQTDTSGYYSLQASAGTYGIFITNYQNGGSVIPNLPPYFSLATYDNYAITQSKVVDITIPAKKIDIHVQNTNGNSVDGIYLTTNSTGGSGGISLGGDMNNFAGYSFYTQRGVTTDTNGNATMWLLPSSASSPYTITATPPSGSVYNTFNLSNVSIASDQMELISLQYSHVTPITTVTLSPNPDSQGNCSDSVTVTLSATAASDYTVANTYYKIDGEAQQAYSIPFTVSGNGSHTINY
jgi:hypothetical protein